MKKYLVLHEQSRQLQAELATTRKYLFEQFYPHQDKLRNHRFAIGSQTIRYYTFKKYDQLTQEHLRQGLAQYAKKHTIDIDLVLDSILKQRNQTVVQALKIE